MLRLPRNPLRTALTMRVRLEIARITSMLEESMLLKALSSMFYITLLMLLFMYVMALLVSNPHQHRNY